MPRQPIPLVPPKRGLNDARAFSEQPLESTAISLNMRTQQDSTGRLRVSTRPGFQRFNQDQLGKNYLAFTEDFGHVRDTFEGDQPFPLTEGWIAGVTGAGSARATADGTLGPDGASPAQLVEQVIASGADRLELGQTFDVNDPATSLQARPGATWVRTATSDIILSVYIKEATASSILLALRQGTTAGFNRTAIEITWTAGTPSITTTTTDGAGNHPTGLVEEDNGWWRAWVGITWEPGDEPTAPVLRCLIQPNEGDALEKGTYLWGAQVELVPLNDTEPTTYEPVLGLNNIPGKRKGANLRSVTHLQRTETFVRKPDQLEAERTFSGEENQRPQDVKYDRMGNRYVLFPQSIGKYSASGALVYSIPIPCADPAHVCETLHLDITDTIFVGVSSGGDPKTAKLVCFRQGPEVVGGRLREDSFHQLWEVTTEQYVVTIDEHEGRLYTAQDDPERARSELVRYTGLDFQQPTVDLRRQTSYPSRGLKVKKDGSWVQCHGANATRGLDPSANGSDTLGPWPTAVGWTPMANLSSWRDRCWSSLDSEFLNGPGRLTADEFEEDDDVLAWVDLTGKNRNLYPRLVTGVRQPVPSVNLKGASGIPGVRFDASNSESLESNPNPGTDPTAKDLQRSLIPAYDLSLIHI